MNKLPDTLDFIPKPPKNIITFAIREKAPEVLASRDRGLKIARKYGKDPYKPNPKERAWIFYDTLITMVKEDFNDYYEIYNSVLKKSYPWEITHWLKNWYSIWRYLRLHLGIHMEEADGVLFYTISRPFPPGITSPDAIGQPFSFYKIIDFLHTIQRRDKIKEVVQEIIKDTEVLDKLLKGQIIPYEYTEVLSFSSLYDKVTNYIIFHPNICRELPPEHQRIIENLRKLHPNDKAIFKAPWFLEAYRLAKEGKKKEAEDILYSDDFSEEEALA